MSPDPYFTAIEIAITTLKSQIQQLTQEIRALRVRDSGGHTGSPMGPTEVPLKIRSELLYLHILGATKNVFFMTSPQGQRYSTVSSQDALINILLTGPQSNLYGITERTLQDRFAAANRTIAKRIILPP